MTKLVFYPFRVSNECWIMVEQIPLVECGNYYSLFLEIDYDCVKDPLGNCSLGQIQKRKNFVERLDLNDVISWYQTLLIQKEMTIGLPIGLRSKVLSRQKIAVSCLVSFPTFLLLHHLLKKKRIVMHSK